MNAVSIHIFDVNRTEKKECKFYNMCVTTGEDSPKASTLFGAISETLTNNGIDRDNV